MTRLLIVDDEALVLRSLTTVLTRAAYEVVPVGSAEDALAALELDHVRLVISDVNMPSMSGIDLARAMEQRRLEIPIVLLSARPSDLVRADAQDCRLVRAVCQKPLAPHELVELVHTILHEPR